MLEYLPYRLNDAMASGDHQQMTYFAGCGIAGVRVDIRGSGESDGLCPDEYTEQEQLDCLEVIAWIAGQPWCTGAVGMMGYSWSGFNCLQVAARRPPALKAIASIFASDDRYADDVHYRGGLVIPMEMVHWSTCILGWQARPPDARIVGDRWREMWLERLELEPWIAHWLPHQRRDAYWQQGSVREDYGRIECPVLCVAGWTDGYTDAAFRLMEGLEVPRHALIGPWGHHDPVRGVPGPAVGILGELVRWWKRWLEGVDSGIADDPMVVAYLQDSVVPSANLAERPGRYVGEDAWPSPRIVPRTMLLGDGTLGGSAPESGTRSIGSVQTVGLEGGAWCADGRSADLPLDQRGEDARSLTFTSEPLAEPLEILGFPEARLVVASDRPLALVSARLCEVQPDGASLLVTRGQLNLCHRTSHAEPVALVPGEEVEVTVRMDSIGHRFPAGSRIRLSVSPCYWPLAWPSPEPVTLTLRHGGSGFPGAARAPGARRGRAATAARRAGGARTARHDAAARRLGRVPADRARSREWAYRADLRLGLRRSYAVHERDRVRGHVGRDVLDRRGRSALGTCARREHLRARPGRLAGLDPRGRDDDLHRDDVSRHVGARGQRGRRTRLCAHVDARVPARLLLRVWLVRPQRQSDPQPAANEPRPRRRSSRATP